MSLDVVAKEGEAGFPVEAEVVVGVEGEIVVTGVEDSLVVAMTSGGAVEQGGLLVQGGGVYAVGGGDLGEASGGGANGGLWYSVCLAYKHRRRRRRSEGRRYGE